jgi:hypothetical protein
MKKLLLLLAAPAVLMFASCGGASKNAETKTLPGTMTIDLNINDNHLSIMVPDSTRGKLDVKVQPSGATEIRVGKDFQISIEEGEGDIALRKSDIAGDDVNKFKRYVKEEPNLLLWESSIFEQPSEFHFYTIQKAGNRSYEIKDIVGDTYSEKGVEFMIECSKTLKAKEGEKPNS